MSEQQQGAGWWLASDGRWYPPEQHPAVVPPGGWTAPSGPDPAGPAPWGAPPPAPVPPRAGMSPGGKVALVVGCVLGAVALLVIVVTLLGTTDDKPEATPLPGATGEAYETFEDPERAFTIDLAPGWVGTSIRGDISGLGDRVAPDSPDVATAIDNAVGALPRQVLFFALDGRDIATGEFTPNLNILRLPRDGMTLDRLEVEARPGIEAFGATDITFERITGALGEGVRVEYSYAPGGALAGVEGRQFYFLTGDDGWVLTFVSDDIGADEARFDAMAASFSAP